MGVQYLGKTKKRNKTMELVSGGQINLLKTPGLSEVKFTALLPNQPYHFAMYEGGYRNAHSYLDKLEALKVNRKSTAGCVVYLGADVAAFDRYAAEHPEEAEGETGGETGSQTDGETGGE